MEQKLQFESELLIEELAWTQNYNPPPPQKEDKKTKRLFTPDML